VYAERSAQSLPIKELQMNAHTDLIDRYFDAWNETDGERRRKLIAATWATDADYRDPLMAGSATTESTR